MLRKAPRKAVSVMGRRDEENGSASCGRAGNIAGNDGIGSVVLLEALPLFVRSLPDVFGHVRFINTELVRVFHSWRVVWRSLCICSNCCTLSSSSFFPAGLST